MKTINSICTVGQRVFFVPDGTRCDCCNESAAFLVVTEADSFGGEATHYCNEHYLDFNNNAIKEEIGVCELCDCESEYLVSVKDPEEGFSGRFYLACPSCRSRLSSQSDYDIEDID